MWACPRPVALRQGSVGVGLFAASPRTPSSELRAFRCNPSRKQPPTIIYKLFTKNMKLIYTTALIVCLFAMLSLQAQVSDDPTFNPNDNGSMATGFTENVGTTAALRNSSNGTILLAGIFTLYNQNTANRLVRLLPSGLQDPGFSAGTSLSGEITRESGLPFGSTIARIKEQPGGGYLLAGNFISYNGTTRRGVIRILASGAIDNSFNDGGFGANGVVNDILPLSNGKFIICGAFTQYNGVAINRLARLNADGTLDASFNGGGTGANLAIFSLDTTSTGMLIAAGTFTSYNGTPVKRIARINTDGSLDISYTPVSTPNSYITSVKVIAGDKMLVGGSFSNYGLSVGHFVRLNADGNRDLTFLSGTACNGDVNTITVETNGKILLGGNFTNYNSNAVKYFVRANADGSYDPTFNPNGYGPGNFGSGASINYIFPTSAGKYFIGGNMAELELVGYNGAAQILENGLPDTDFNPATGISSGANTGRCIAAQPDGKIIIGGNFTKYNGQPRRFIARLLTDGSVDPTFGANTLQGFNNTVTAIAVQPDGKILVAGDFLFYGSTRRNNLARLNADGTLDASFNPVSQINGRVQNITKIKLLPGGKILLVGGFVNFNLLNTIKIMVLLNADGTVDNGFVSPITGGTVDDVLPIANGKLVVGGNFLQLPINGTNTSRSLFRLNADGTVDNTFNNGNATTNGPVQSLLLLADGKILVGGTFMFINGSSRNGLVRLNADGTLDASFPVITSPALAFNPILAPVAMYERADGSYAIAGRVEARVSNSIRRWQGVTIVSAAGVIAPAVYTSNFRVFGSPINPTDLFTEGTINDAVFTNTTATVLGSFAYSGEGKRRNSIARLLLGNTALPVTFTLFTATRRLQNVHLQWTTANEQNNRGFTAERSSDGINFRYIGFVNAIGNGNSSQEANYQFTDIEPGTGILYYRLKQTDLDGTFTYSEVRQVQMANSTPFTIVPTIANTEVVAQVPVNSNGKPSFVQLIDPLGRLLKEQKVNGGSVRFSVERLPKGAYYIRLQTADKKASIQRFIVQH